MLHLKEKKNPVQYGLNINPKKGYLNKYISKASKIAIKWHTMLCRYKLTISLPIQLFRPYLHLEANSENEHEVIKH